MFFLHVEAVEISLETCASCRGSRTKIDNSMVAIKALFIFLYFSIYRVLGVEKVLFFLPDASPRQGWASMVDERPVMPLSKRAHATRRQGKCAGNLEIGGERVS